MSISQAVSDAAFRAARAEIDEAGYGFMVSDAKVRSFANGVAEAAVDAARKETAWGQINAKQPLQP